MCPEAHNEIFNLGIHFQTLYLIFKSMTSLETTKKPQKARTC